MRILVNHTAEDVPYLPILQYHLRQRKLEALSTSSALTISELLTKAKNSKCDAILLCNPDTLKNCVPGDDPSLDMYRGSRLNFSVPVIVTNPLAHCHTVDHGAWLLCKDLDKFSQLDYRSPVFDFEVLDLVAKFKPALTFLSSCFLISYDIETVTLNENEEADPPQAGDTLITCCSWTGINMKGEIKTFVLPVIDFMIEHWTPSEYALALKLLRDINKLSVKKVMHNGMYDSLHSIVYHAEPRNWTLDTMAMMHSEFVTLPKTLDFCASVTIPDYIQWKGEAEAASKGKDIQRYWAYNARDTYYTLLICMHQLKNQPSYAKKNYATQFKLVYPFLYCNFEGILISNTKRLELKSKAQIKLDEALKSLRICFSDPKFNPGSYKQVQVYIYDLFGAVDPRIGQKRDANNKKVRITRGTDAKNLTAVGEQHPLLLRLTDAIISYREAQKAIGTYFDFLQMNGRLLYNINPFGTETGRASAQSSSFWCGTQVQNIPPYAKDMLVADEGFILAEIDNSQSEARCTAYLSRETSLIAALEDKTKDFYKTLGTLFFNIPYAEVTTDFRNSVLKKIVHGTNYMMGAVTFIENAGAMNLIKASSTLGTVINMSPKIKKGEVTLKQFASSLLEAYHGPFPRVRLWYQEIKSQISASHTLVSPLGWTRYFFGDIMKKHQIFASAVAHGPQNLSVSILNIGLWKAWEIVKREEGDIRLKAQIHDSLLFQYKKDRPELRAEVQKALDNPVTIHKRVLRIPTDCKVGASWGNMEKMK